MDFTRKTSCDRRGRVFVDGLFLEFESEIDTFKALATKYLKGTLLVDPLNTGTTRFVVGSSVPAPATVALAGSCQP